MEASQECERLDFCTRQVVPLAPLPEAWWDGAAVEFEGEIMTVGGEAPRLRRWQKR